MTSHIRPASRRWHWLCLSALLAAFVHTATSAQAAVTGLRVGIYSGNGAEASTILAIFRAVASLGHLPMALTTADLDRGRLTTATIDVFVIPPGQSGRACCAGYYGGTDALGSASTQAAIRTFLQSGGGVVAEEAGALLASQNGGALDLYAGTYASVTTDVGVRAFDVVHAAFGGGAQAAWHSVGGGFFPAPPGGVTVVAVDSASRPVVVTQRVGLGRLALTSFVLELRGDTTLDWTIWDNWAMGGTHANSEGAWGMLGRLIGWASYAEDSSPPTVAPTPLPPGVAVAVVAERTLDGGAWPGLLPAVGRGIEFSGHVPLAIRFQDIKDGRLTLANFRVVTMPGGYAYGYKTGLAGYEHVIRRFVRSGGSYYGICAGSFYTPATIVWEHVTYPYPLSLYPGQAIGPIDDIAPWPGYALTPVDVVDPLLGNLGRTQSLYYGGGYHTMPFVDPRSLSRLWGPIQTAGMFAQSSAAGQAAVVRYEFGNGRVALTTTHLEARAGSATDDWLAWDDYDYTTGASVTNPDNPWLVMKALFTHWLAQ
jgi:glutamine amidotransferase-like uncharacterized protein